MLADALRRLPDEQLAALVRALPDDLIITAARAFVLTRTEAFFGQALSFDAPDHKAPLRPVKRAATPPPRSRRKRGFPAKHAELVREYFERVDDAVPTSEICKATGLSPFSVRIALKELAKEGAVLGEGQTRSRRYRRAGQAEPERVRVAEPEAAPTSFDVDGADEDEPVVLDERPRRLNKMPPAPSQEWLRR